MKSKINSQLDFIDQQTGKTVKGYDTQEYIIISSNNGGWKTYTIQFVDPNGNGVDHKGIPTSGPRYYKISQRYLDQDRLKNTVDFSAAVQQAIDRTEEVQRPCPPENQNQSSVAPLTSPRPRVRPSLVDSIPAEGGSSMDFLMPRRKDLRAGGHNSCMALKEKVQDAFVSKHPFGSMSIAQRATAIHDSAKTVLQNMNSSSAEKGNKSGSRYKNFVNGHYIDPVVTPAVAACISYQETKGNLNPFAVNYTYCNKRMTSTAHGLGQMTFSTMEGMFDNPDGEMIPLNTPASAKYSGMSPSQVHSKMSGDVDMQLEILMRVVSANAKYIRWRNSGLSESEILKRAIIMYDRDAQSNYIKNVFTNCVPCFNNGGSASSCYNKVK